MRLILTRHGETIENAEGIRQGHLPGRLSELGKAQAVRLALRLKDERIDAIYSSDLARAADTAKEIAKFHSVPITYTEELREYDNGILKGRKRSETMDIDWKNNPPAGAELRPEGLARAKRFIDKVYEWHNGETILFVTHGFFMKALITAILHKDVEYFDEIDHIDNTSVNIFEFCEDRKHKIILLNDIRHLEN
jgi:broad specificity phosphatase PhoE